MNKFYTNNKKYKKQQILKALKLSYTIRKKKLNSTFIFSKLNNIILYTNIGIKSKIPNIFHNINFNWLLKK
uniref:ORF-D n=1 Tax=Cyclospora cayetanensis TaxID=88456 RepID=A0A0K0NU13_9EIME|nr:ORF-D [Cyclospora cayetanensis]AKO71997.1 ORF-D [Cyclospora cayetanensis]ANJ44350.1 ORF-D [Cyclospora cayetanensis]ANN13284.1 ORF-D [Cyclospora cayetanensis]ANN13313.1 ORF-D [Cyclospora cayetanensis]ANN13342.1 ORF-D [Cyclospora cayetanensis]